MKKRLPISISEFREIREGNYIYVDKTKILYELTQGKQYFLSRPRRFGKTLLISTLEQLFLGNKELFQDTWIATSDYQWQHYPVIRLNFSGMSHDSGKNFEHDLLGKLMRIGDDHNINLSEQQTISGRLTALMEQLSKVNPVVILIDEYDHPLISNVAEKELPIAQEIQRVMQSFFATVKATEPYMRFCFLTGVSRFSKTSIFSGLNNLRDITFNPLAADLLGYTQQELEHYFNDYVIDLAQDESASVADTYAKLKTWYNGYRFSDKTIKVYNPFSIINVLGDKKFIDYWFGSGTPGFLIKLLPNYGQELENLATTTFDANTLRSSFEVGKLRLDLLLYQTGYVTISNYDDDVYSLDFPNQEVRTAFNLHLLSYLADKDIVAIGQIARQIKKALKICDLQKVFEHLQSLFANLPYQLHNKRESYYHSMIHTFFYTLNLSVTSEHSTSRGRSDLVLETAKYIYIFEVKLDTSPQDALDQIETQKYYEPFLQLNKKIVLVGINFSYSDKRLEIEYKSM